MPLQSLLAGFIAQLTPAVLIWSLISLVVFSKLQVEKKNRHFFVLIFSGTVLTYYVIQALALGVLSSDVYERATLYGAEVLSNIVVAAMFLLIFCLLGVADTCLRHQAVKVVVIVIMGLLFSTSTYSSTASLMGTVAIMSYTKGSFWTLWISVISFALGLLFLLTIVLVFTSKSLAHLNEKRWWRILQKITALIIFSFMVLGTVQTILSVKV